MSQAGLFDYSVVNDDLDVASADLLAILRAERLRRGGGQTLAALGLG